MTPAPAVANIPVSAVQTLLARRHLSTVGRRRGSRPEAGPYSRGPDPADVV